MDPVTISIVAAATLKVLGPYFSKFAEKFADGVVDSSAGAALAGAKKLFGLIKAKFTSRPEAEQSLARMEANPEDSSAQAEVKQHLETLMAQDPKFAADLQDRITQISNTHAELAFVNNIQGDVNKLVQIGNVEGNVTI